MANFKTAVRKLLDKEGGFVNNPNDAGGMTFCGISRVWWPKCPIWHFIDQRLSHGQRPLPTDQELVSLVESHYKQYFWSSLNLGQVANQRVAEAIFDTAANMHTVVAAKYAQECANLLQSEQLVVDGKIGVKTLRALNTLQESVADFIELLRSRRHWHRWERLRKDPTDREFMRGWILNRDNLI